MNLYDVKYYKLDLAVENNSLAIRGNATMDARALSPLSDVTIELHQAMTVDSIRLNDSLVKFSRQGAIMTVNAAADLPAGQLFRLQVFYHGNAPGTGSGALGDPGFSTDKSHKVTWSLSQPFSAYEWWPCKQVLSDKADSSSVWVTTDSANRAGSNGLLKRRVDLLNGKARYEWNSHYPIAYYLISLAVSPYQVYNQYARPQGSDSILVSNYIYKNAAPEVKASLAYTPQLIEYFSGILGPYPFANEKYGHCQAEISGGMEHQTMTTLGVFNFTIVAHELAHQWFGDFVTCGSWADIWLNEGFASYGEFLALEALNPAGKDAWMNDAMENGKVSTGTVHVQDSTSPEMIFSFTSTYQKGAVLLHMLRYEINNDSLFYLGLRTYLQSKSYSTALAPEFFKVMEQVSGISLDYFTQQWYYGPGYPIFSGRWGQSSDKVMVELRQEPSEGNTVFRTWMDVQLFYPGGDTTIRSLVSSQVELLELQVKGKKITGIRLDPKNHVLNDVISIAHDPGLNLQHLLAGSFITLFPNPAQEVLTVSHAAGCISEVLDLAGRKLLRSEIDSDQHALDVSSLSPGIYMLQLTKNGGSYAVKFIKS
jgi:aminopeptidase N